MAALLLFIALAVALFAPRGMNVSRRHFFNRDAAAFALALFSACALPWGGVSLLRPLSLGSEAWLPFFAAAVVMAPKGRFDGYCGRAVLIVSIIAFEAAMSLFMSRAGIPGRLYSIEGFSMILRLCPFVSAIAMCLAAAGLLLSFLGMERGCAAFRPISFSFSGFLITLVPLDFSVFWRAAPRLLAILTPGAIFTLSCVVSYLFIKGETIPECVSLSQKFVPLAVTAAGCLLLAIQ
jgi:hypothetical protein